MAQPWLVPIEGGVELLILAVPRASRSKVAGIHDGRLKVQLAAPPADGAANEALLALIIELGGVKKSAVSLVQGHGHRQKRVRIMGLDPGTAERIFGATA
ncbi:MAG: DUF167 domain-containing protein [Deltaproteobacteria bacterium]|jgi:uncharacterized protein (TIGR00251 family)|nr:DUF167 domain-containing protein [Deltaproteobacteria bacterium]